MTDVEAAELLVIVGFGGFILWRWVIAHHDLERRLAIKHQHLNTYDVARTGTWLIPQFAPYIREGAAIYIPSADGLYAMRLKGKRSKFYKNGLKEWIVGKQAIIHLIITIPTEEGRQEWQSWKNAYPEQIHVYLLHRENVSGPNADLMRSQILKLDTFHPVLLVNPPSGGTVSGAMWIEAYHPVGSKFAYNVEIVPPERAVTDKRFDQYKDMYKSLLQGPHVEILKPNDAQGRIAA